MDKKYSTSGLAVNVAALLKDQNLHTQKSRVVVDESEDKMALRGNGGRGRKNMNKNSRRRRTISFDLD